MRMSNENEASGKSITDRKRKRDIEPLLLLSKLLP
jgi:hypothetical protein